MKGQREEKIKNERDIFAIGRPDIERLPKNEQKVFFSTLLERVVEYYAKESKCGKEKTD